MATYLLIRHGTNDTVGRAIAGRSPGVHLNEAGCLEAQRIADLLADTPIDLICSSPLERAVETALPLSRKHGREILIREGINEIDFGDWTGLEFHELEPLARWRQFNAFRTGTRIPGGELMVEVQERMVTEFDRLQSEAPQGTIAVFSHGDPIKAVIAHYAGIPLDLCLRMEISTGSLSIISVNDYGPRVLCVNRTDGLPPLNDP